MKELKHICYLLSYKNGSRHAPRSRRGLLRRPQGKRGFSGVDSVAALTTEAAETLTAADLEAKEGALEGVAVVVWE